MRAKIVKNKVAPPFRQAEFDIEYGLGISTEGCLIDLGIEHGIVQKSGAFFSYDGERLGQGRNNAKAFLRENARWRPEIEAKIYAALGHRSGRVAVGPRAPRRTRPTPTTAKMPETAPARGSADRGGQERLSSGNAPGRRAGGRGLPRGRGGWPHGGRRAHGASSPRVNRPRRPGVATLGCRRRTTGSQRTCTGLRRRHSHAYSTRALSHRGRGVVSVKAQDVKGCDAVIDRRNS